MEAAALPSSTAAALSPAAVLSPVDELLPPHPASTVATMATERIALSNFFLLLLEIG